MKRLVTIFVLCCMLVSVTACAKTGSSAFNADNQNSGADNQTSGADNQTTGIDSELAGLIEEIKEYAGTDHDHYAAYNLPDYPLEVWSTECEALGKLLQRDDYAAPMMELYMEAELPAYSKKTLPQEEYTKFRMAEILELVLAQSSVCEQLNDAQRLELVNKLLENARLRKDHEAYCVVQWSGFFWYILWHKEDSAWYKVLYELPIEGEKLEFMKQMLED